MRGRKFDGEISRALEGRTISGVAKDGRVMEIFATNGERWRIAWADFLSGVGFDGEPVIISVGDVHARGETPAHDGHVHRALVGKTIERAMTDGELLLLELVGGESYGIGWIDPATGARVEAEPCLVRVDVSVAIEPVAVFGAASNLTDGR